MNKFTLLACIGIGICINIASTQADLSLGYRYHQGHSSGGSDFLSTPAQSSSSFAPIASGNAYFNAAPAIGQTSNAGYGSGSVGSLGGFGGFGSSGSGGQFIGGGSSQSGQFNYQDEQQSFANQAPIVTKHFYLHTAPVDHDDQQIVRYVNVGRPQKNYRVVFIDTPSTNTAHAKIIANVAPTEDKTAIYVLSKKASALDVSAEVVTQPSANHKPEVFFVKYKTPEEAIHAQHTIQAQYDALGGSSNVSNEGAVPVSSFIGSLGGSSGGGEAASIGADNGEQTQNVGSAISIPQIGTNVQQNYLPANHY